MAAFNCSRDPKSGVITSPYYPSSSRQEKHAFQSRINFFKATMLNIVQTSSFTRNLSNVCIGARWAWQKCSHTSLCPNLTDELMFSICFCEISKVSPLAIKKKHHHTEQTCVLSVWTQSTISIHPTNSTCQHVFFWEYGNHAAFFVHRIMRIAPKAFSLGMHASSGNKSTPRVPIWKHHAFWCAKDQRRCFYAPFSCVWIIQDLANTSMFFWFHSSVLASCQTLLLVRNNMQSESACFSRCHRFKPSMQKKILVHFFWLGFGSFAMAGMCTCCMFKTHNVTSQKQACLCVCLFALWCTCIHAHSDNSTHVHTHQTYIHTRFWPCAYKHAPICIPPSKHAAHSI